MLYGSETWTLGVSEKRRIEAFEMWCYRRILKTSWVDKVTNEEIPQVKNRLCLLRMLSRRRTNWIGHILRHASLLHTMIEGNIIIISFLPEGRLDLTGDFPVTVSILGKNDPQSGFSLPALGW